MMELKNLDNSLRMLSLFTPDTGLLGVRDISGRMGLSPSMVHRILSTFQAHGFVRQCEATRKYGLSFRVFELDQVFQTHFNLNDAIQSLVREAAFSSGRVVQLHILDRHQAICLQVARHHQGAASSVNCGERMPLHLGSQGRIILAHLADDLRATLLARAEAETEHFCKERMEIELCNARKQGYARFKGARASDPLTISVPLFDQDRQIMGAVTLRGPDRSVNGQDADEQISTAHALSSAIQAQFVQGNATPVT